MSTTERLSNHHLTHQQISKQSLTHKLKTKNMETETLLQQPPPPNTIKVHKDSIKVGQRFREDLGTTAELQELADSIKAYGIIHPLAVDENWNLVAGGRRYHVCVNILGWTELPITLAETKNEEITLRIMEAEENFRRKAMNWKEKVR